MSLNILQTFIFQDLLTTVSAQLLCFCDESNKLCTRAVYLRNITNSTVNILFSKAQNVLKRKELTIPRLEVLSVWIGVKNLLFFTKALKIEVIEKVLWTDSKCVLLWIKGGGIQSIFVRNRIKEITEKQSINFRYINTNHNPVGPQDSKLWCHGLSWLSEEFQLWTTWNFHEIGLEKKYKEGIKMASISRETMNCWHHLEWMNY